MLNIMNIDEISHCDVCGRAIFVSLVCRFHAKRAFAEGEKSYLHSLYGYAFDVTGTNAISRDSVSMLGASLFRISVDGNATRWPSLPT